MLGKLKSIVKLFLPDKVYSYLLKVYLKVKKPFETIIFEIKLKKVKQNHEKALKEIRSKKKIKVAFFLIHEPTWKYEGLYRLFENDNRFDPVVIVCPFISFGDEIMIDTLTSAFESFLKKGYKVINSLKPNGIWLNVKEEISPDLVFFTNPWYLTKPQYYMNEYLDTLTCYVPYFYQVTKHLGENFGGLVQNLSWRVFYESEKHLEYAQKYSKNNCSNVVITGYPGLDPFLYKREYSFDPWKIEERLIKRIIWAPHHTIEGQDSGLGFSNFHLYFDFFKYLAETRYNELQIAFKPHPLLKAKLYKDPNWGKNRTDKYYKFWNDCPNGQLIEGSYIDLFIYSDALIHDSGSFTVEYLSLNKPVLYLQKNEEQLKGLNSIGIEAVNCHYIARDTDGINDFINQIVSEQNDFLQERRLEFINKYLLQENHKPASENIYNHIVVNIIEHI